MENLDNFEIYLKVFVAFIGAIAAFVKLKEGFASIKQKKELKLDLEILEKLKLNDNIQTSEIEEKIKLKLDKAFENRTENLTNFFTGIAVFIGFGFWSVDILQNSNEFNGWFTLTLLCSLIGLALIVGNNDKKEKEEIFYQLEFYDKSNFQTALIIIFLTGVLTPILIWKIDGFSFWQFLSGLFFFIGIASLMRSIKRIKNNG